MGFSYLYVIKMRKDGEQSDGPGSSKVRRDLLMSGKSLRKSEKDWRRLQHVKGQVKGTIESQITIQWEDDQHGLLRLPYHFIINADKDLIAPSNLRN